jgi:membrane protein
MLGTAWPVAKQTVYDFIDDNALSRAAAIAYYTLFSLAPILVIVIAIAGFAFGQDAAQGALSDQLRGLMGQQGADLVQSMVKGASNRHAGTIATVIGIVTLIITATGVFSELQADLNAIWKAETPTGVSAIVRTRALSLGLVAALGFLLLVSLVVSAALSGLSTYVNGIFPGAAVLFRIASLVVSLTLISAMFAAIYKVLPDKPLGWREVGVGAVGTALLFTAGKFLIGLYIGSSAVASSYGAAGTAIVLLLWIYYSALIFLLGAEFTKIYAQHRGSPEAPPAPGTQPAKPAPTATVSPRPAAAQALPRRRPFRALDVVALGTLAAALLRRRGRP